VTGPARDDAPQIRLFTLEEANALLPAIEPTLESLRDLKEQLDTAKIELDRFTPAMRGNGHGTDVLALERRIAELIAQISAGIDEISAHGVEIKDLNHGLIDFPSLREGRVVYLCWRLGEDQIAYWHDLDAGFAGRQPI
jgi:hypothetical protein